MELMRYSFVGYFLMPAVFLVANPNDPNVVHGQAQFSADGNTLNVTTSDKAIIEWNRFSIDRGETTAFLQPNSSSSVLNRVMSSDPSRLFGTLQSNGKVYLINQNGILVGSSGLLQTAAFIGSTFDVLNQDFVNGSDLTFQGSSTAHLINEGSIQALDGDVVLIGQFVKNTGNLSAPNGFCGIGCGEQVLLKMTGEEKLYILAPIQTRTDQEAGVQQQGTIQALSAEIKASGNPFALAILHEGIIDAIGFKNEDGNVYLVAENGNLHVNGEIRAKRNGEGGTVHLHADQVVLAEAALIDVSAPNKGGSVFIGKDPAFVANPKAIFTHAKASIFASSMENGDGGSVILWSEELNLFNGTILARGGSLGGDGGFVDISSPKGLFPSGHVETLAPFGKQGTLLFDPIVVTISGAATTGTVTPPGAGVCPQPATSYDFAMVSPSNILNTDLSSFLQCNDVSIFADQAGPAGSASITVSAPITWSMNPSQLHLRANGAGGLITVNNDITVTSVAATVNDLIWLEAPTVDITSTGVAINVEASTGNIRIDASTLLNIDAANGAISVSTLAASSPGIITVLAGNVDISSPSTFPSSLTAENALNLTATGFLNLTGGGNGGSCLIRSNNGNVGLGITGPIALLSGTQNDSFAQIQTNGSISPNNITINCSNTLSITSQGAGSTNAEAAIFTNNGGNITVTNCTGLTMTGTSLGDLAQIKALSGANSGLVNLTISGNSTMNSFSRIDNAYTGAHATPTVDLSFGGLSMLAATGSAVINSSQDINIDLTVDLILRGTLSGAAIQGNNDITVTAIGAAVIETLMGAGGAAQITSANAGSTITVGAESLLIKAAGGVANIISAGPVDVTVAGGTRLETTTTSTAGASISAGGAGNALTLQTFSLDMVSAGQAVVIGGSGSIDITATGGDINLDVAVTGVQTVIQGGSVTPGDALTITAQAPGGSLSLESFSQICFISSFTKPATFNLAGDLTLITHNGGVAAIAAAFQSGSGDLNVTARNISTQGGTAAGGGFGLATISTGAAPFGGGGNGKVILTSTGSTGVTINGGTIENSMSGIFTFGSSSTNDIQVTLTNPSANLTITANGGGGVVNAFAGIGTGIITVANGGGIPVLNHGGGSVTVDVAGGNISLSAVSAANPAEIRANSTGGPFAGALLAKAGANIDVGANSQIVNNFPVPSGSVTLVTDNINSVAPAIGGGIFILNGTGAVTTGSGQGLFIYTSTQEPLNVNGQLNGVMFAPGTACVDTDTEQWGLYYPDNPNAKIGMDYTFFYKSCYVAPPVPPVVPTTSSAALEILIPGTRLNNRFVQSITEAFTDWSYWLDYVGYAMRTIEIRYENVEEMRNLISQDALSSFDLPSWYYKVYIQTHRGYHLLKLDQRL